MLSNRPSRLFYQLVGRLIWCRLARDYQEYHASTEDSYVARIVLDHADASISLKLKTPWGRVTVGLMACLGEEQVRRPGLFVDRWSF